MSDSDLREFSTVTGKGETEARQYLALAEGATSDEGSAAILQNLSAPSLLLSLIGFSRILHLKSGACTPMLPNEIHRSGSVQTICMELLL